MCIRDSNRFIQQPTTLFIGLLVMLIAVVVLWEIGFVELQSEASKMAERLNINPSPNPGFGLVILVIGNILLGMTFVGLVMFFLLAQKLKRLTNQQRDFISSVTHELRTPISGLRLAVESMQNKSYSPDQKQDFTKMMLVDIDRLNSCLLYTSPSPRDRG